MKNFEDMTSQERQLERERLVKFYKENTQDVQRYAEQKGVSIIFNMLLAVCGESDFDISEAMLMLQKQAKKQKEEEIKN